MPFSNNSTELAPSAPCAKSASRHDRTRVVLLMIDNVLKRDLVFMEERYETHVTALLPGCLVFILSLPPILVLHAQPLVDRIVHPAAARLDEGLATLNQGGADGDAAVEVAAE